MKHLQKLFNWLLNLLNNHLWVQFSCFENKFLKTFCLNAEFVRVAFVLAQQVTRVINIDKKVQKKTLNGGKLI